ncbi:MAG: hypothetical protein D6728_13570 [Cyanobacteria bacterium J055]|nr:MAG: hypothetical protein D6728_13570 [Cyanobacteria bacterium J055]
MPKTSLKLAIYPKISNNFASFRSTFSIGRKPQNFFEAFVPISADRSDSIVRFHQGNSLEIVPCHRGWVSRGFVRSRASGMGTRGVDRSFFDGAPTETALTAKTPTSSGRIDRCKI